MWVEVFLDMWVDVNAIKLFSLLKKVQTCMSSVLQTLGKSNIWRTISGVLSEFCKFEDVFEGKKESDLFINFFRLLI